MGLKDRTAQAVIEATKKVVENKMSALRDKYKGKINDQINNIQELYDIQQQITRESVIDRLKKNQDFIQIFNNLEQEGKRATFKAFYEQILAFEQKEKYWDAKEEIYSFKSGKTEADLIKEITNAMTLILEIRKDFLNLTSVEETITIIYEMEDGKSLRSVSVPMKIFFGKMAGEVLTIGRMSTAKAGFRDSRQITFSDKGRNKLVELLNNYAKENESAVKTYSKEEYERLKKKRIGINSKISQSGETGYIAEGLIRRALLGHQRGTYGRNTGSYSQRPDIFGINRQNNNVIISSAKSLLAGNPTLIAVQSVIDDLYKIQQVFTTMDNDQGYNMLKDKIFRISKSEEDIAKEAAKILRKKI